MASVAISPDGTLLAAGYMDTTVRIWRVADSVLLHTLSRHTNSVESVAFSPDGQTVATGSDDSTIKLWSAADGNLLADLCGARWRRGGRVLLAGRANAGIRQF